MGFEKFFLRGEAPTQKNEEEEEELPDPSKRSFLIGAGALAAASVLPSFGVHAEEANKEKSLSFEEKERNVQRIRKHEAHLKRYQEELARPGISKKEICDILYGEDGVPPSTEEYLQGTELDQREFFSEHDSWVCMQLKKVYGKEELYMKFAHETPAGKEIIMKSGNGFLINNMMVSNRHMLEDDIPCEIGGEGKDIAGISFADLGMLGSMQENIERSGLAWDRSKALEDIHGKFAHIPSLHPMRSEREDLTTITSGHIFKITESFLHDPQFYVQSFFTEADSKAYRDLFLNSYAMIVPSQDTNLDGKSDQYDIEGVSGSPVFTNEDCDNGRRVPSGIQWGAMTIADKSRRITYTLVLFHGPEVVGEMVDTVNTILSQGQNEEEVPNKRALTLKVQEALVAYGYRKLPIDGEFGRNTSAVIQAFQEREFDEHTRKTSIIPGVMDRMTWKALFPNEGEPDKAKLWGVSLLNNE